ncbi:hypothetical protein EYF80_056478 [Liparis tanakae]|uniref:Uncharacterized protein n=1 Tax=Liparis tanakae TaxID=230148 RepID=A0A4Z2EXM6_9TELE|nr:hypothetical protein EYF80_056478 [Liparis tanakae]
MAATLLSNLTVKAPRSGCADVITTTTEAVCDVYSYETTTTEAVCDVYSYETTTTEAVCDVYSYETTSAASVG